MGAGVDCAGPDAGSMLHTMALGESSLPVNPCPPRPRGVTKEQDLAADPATGSAATTKYIFHGQTDTLACVLESRLRALAGEIDFFGVHSERKPNERTVTVLLRPARADEGEGDRIMLRALADADARYAALEERLQQHQHAHAAHAGSR